MIPNCHCNICSVPIFRAKPNSGYNFCSARCQIIDCMPIDPKKQMKFSLPGDRSRVNNRRVSVADHSPWPAPKSILQSYSPNHLLRTRGIKTKRLTTKPQA